MEPKYTLPPLPYAYDALEPIISKEIMHLHHTKHHQTYINNLNATLAALQAAPSIPSLIALQQKLKFNGGGHINHSLFWANLAPYNSPETNLDTAAPVLKSVIEEQWGAVEEFVSAFNAVLLGIQGSGWGWLVSVADGTGKKLEIVTTKDQDPVEGGGKVPLLGVDMWEHAYYLQYLNNKAAYVEGVWKVVNWRVVEGRFVDGVERDGIKL